MSLLGFGIKIMRASWNKLDNTPSSSILWKFVYNWCDFFLKCLVESPLKASGPGVFFMREINELTHVK